MTTDIPALLKEALEALEPWANHCDHVEGRLGRLPSKVTIEADAEHFRRARKAATALREAGTGETASGNVEAPISVNDGLIIELAAWNRCGPSKPIGQHGLDLMRRVAAALRPTPTREEVEGAAVLDRIRVAFSQIGADLTTLERTRALRGLLSYSDFRALAALRPASSGGAWVLVPREPPLELLISMAVRDDHGLGVPGSYDHPIYRQSPSGFEGPTHAQRMESAIGTMRKLYEEVIGNGFYSPERADRYRALIDVVPSDEARETALFVEQGRNAQRARLAGKPFTDWLGELAKIADPEDPVGFLTGSVVLNEECWFDAFSEDLTPAECWALECSNDD